MPPLEGARRQAVISVGGFEKTKQEYRDIPGMRVIEDCFQDLRDGLRQLRLNGSSALCCTSRAPMSQIDHFLDNRLFAD